MTLKLLMLHGYRQNGTAFRAKTGAFRKILKTVSKDIVFISAPFVIEDASQDGTDEAEAKDLGWFFCQSEPRSYHSTTEVPSYSGLDATLEHLDKVFEEHGGFDGIIAFSQGAQLLSIMTALDAAATRAGESPRYPIQFAMFVSGFKSYALNHNSLYTEPVALPSLHILGTTDEVIPDALSRELAACFVDPAIVVHDGGHFVPTPKKGTPEREMIEGFLAQFKLE
eukprot:m.22199 g.22199  ORF g.22199 m.22199 type:complete len:225 (+) comp11217_c0_seq1:49-723(+)